MKLTTLFTKKNIFITSSLFAILLITISELRPANASECSHTNFMAVDRKCINLDSQIKTKKEKAQILFLN